LAEELKEMAPRNRRRDAPHGAPNYNQFFGIGLPLGRNPAESRLQAGAPQ